MATGLPVTGTRGTQTTAASRTPEETLERRPRAASRPVAPRTSGTRPGNRYLVRRADPTTHRNRIRRLVPPISYRAAPENNRLDPSPWGAGCRTQRLVFGFSLIAHRDPGKIHNRRDEQTQPSLRSRPITRALLMSVRQLQCHEPKAPRQQEWKTLIIHV